MPVDIRFTEPIWLWLLLLIPLTWYMSHRLRNIESFRRWSIMTVRTLVLLLVVLALARPEIALRSTNMTVYFLLDVSESIPQQVREDAEDMVRELSANKPRDDEAGLIVFGADASIEALAISTFDFEGPVRSVVNTQGTDMSAAMRLALSAFPNNRIRRMVLLSDGNENIGNALEVARMARNSGVPVDVVSLDYTHERDVQIDNLVIPQQTARDTPFDIKVYLSSDTEEQGLLRIFENDALIVEEEVTVRPGRNPPLVLPRRLQEGGFHRYRAEIVVPGDTRPQNNQALAFTTLRTDPRVLYIEGDQSNRNYLAAALRAEDVNVVFGGPEDIPISLEEMQAYDSVIFSNVHANRMSNQQMRMIERAVHDLGIGFIMIGGEDSFGSGGYQDSPIEEALPVSMDVKQRQVLPNGALVTVLHTVEIPDGNAWAREISLAALDVLSARDYYGLVYYGLPPGQDRRGAFVGAGFSEHFLWEPGLQQVGDKRAMRAMIRGVQPADMPSFDPALRLAYEGLRDITAEAKHIVIISDGDPAPPNRELAQAIQSEGISISTVLIAPHFESAAVQVMEYLAYWGGGNFYYPKIPTELPRIFIKEASVVRRSLIFEETFFPQGDQPSEILAGLDALRELQGYVLTSEKDLATIALRTHHGDPLLAHWRYGLGKTVAFTSDAKNRWAAPWVDWEGFAKFWSQTVRWSLRETSSSNFQVTTDVSGGTGRVVVDALDTAGNFLNFVEFDTTVLGPDMSAQEVTVRQVAPGRYEGEFNAQEVGTYMVRLATGEDEAPETLVSGVALSYSPEFETTQSNPRFMRRIAEESGGRVVEPGYSAFDRFQAPVMQPRPIWELLLLLGLLLVPLDVFLRRVYFDPADIRAAVAKRLSAAWMVMTFRKPKQEEARSEAMGSLMEAKKRAASPDVRKEREEQAAREEFRRRVDEQREQGTGDRESLFADPDKPAPGGPVRHRTKQTVTPQERGSKPQGGSALGGLKEAKKRARDKMK